jgi:hypothetical protein
MNLDPDDLPGLQEPNYRIECRHQRFRKYGWTEYGRQKYRCWICGKQFTDTWTIRPKREEFLRRASELYRAGVTQGPAAKILGCCQQTVCNWYRRFARYEERPKCPCGREGGHKGWCRFRLDQKAQGGRDVRSQALRPTLAGGPRIRSAEELGADHVSDR